MLQKPRVILVTGAAGVIGRAALTRLSGNESRFALIDSDEEKLIRIVEEIGPDRAEHACVDVSDASAVKTIVAGFTARFGTIDAAILAAGIEGPVLPIEEYDDDAFDRVMAVNVRGVWAALKACIGHMKAQKRGSIVALSSTSGVGSAPLMAAYGASKHAVIGLVRAAAREAAEAGVRINAVCPGPIQSDMMARIDGRLRERFPARLRSGHNAAASIPLQRYAQAAEVAEVIAFLCSDASSYCTGAAYMVDGGLTAR